MQDDEARPMTEPEIINRVLYDDENCRAFLCDWFGFSKRNRHMIQLEDASLIVRNLVERDTMYSKTHIIQDIYWPLRIIEWAKKNGITGAEQEGVNTKV